MEISTQQLPVNCAAGKPQIDTPLTMISEAPGELEPVLVAHAVQQPAISD